MSTTNQKRIELMHERLTQTLAPTQLDILDESHLHVGHAGAKSGGGHFAIRIASAQFDNQSKLESHRMIYAALGELMAHDIHAVRISIIS